MASTADHTRDLRLDFFRGIALWLIFLNHIPANVISWVTTRNYGFSDATEIFVFISGYTAAAVYGRLMEERGFVIGTARVLRRAWQLYVAFVFLFVLYIGVIAYVITSFENPLYAEELNVLTFFDEPQVTILQAIVLKFRPSNTDILPLYIVLMLGFPPILRLMLWRSDAGLVVSGLLYLATIQLGWNLPGFPEGRVWIFNPFAWQFLFVFGAWCGLGGARRLQNIVHAPVALLAAVVYLIFSLGIVLSWTIPVLEPLVPNWLGMLIYPIDKISLDPLRLLHFLALALIVVRLVPKTSLFLRHPLAQPAILCGQHSLEIFCVGIFLSFGGHFVLTEYSASLWAQVAVSLAGIIAMIGVAELLSWYRSIDRGRSSEAPATDAGAGGGS